MENNVTCRRPIIFHVDEIIKTVKERIGATAKGNAMTWHGMCVCALAIKRPLSPFMAAVQIPLPLPNDVLIIIARGNSEN